MLNSHETEQRPVRVGLVSLGCAKNLVDAEIMVGSLMQQGMEVTSDTASADVVIVNTCSFIDAAQEESVDAILESAAVREARNRGQSLVVSGCLPQRFREELPKLLPEVDAFIGVDQVAKVPQIIRKAIEHRAQRLHAEAQSKANQPAGKGRIVQRLAQISTAAPAPPEDPSKNLRHTPNFNQTKTVLAPPAPLVEVHSRPNFIPDFATPRFRLTPRHFAYVKIAEGCNHPCSFCTIPRMRGSHRSRSQEDILREAAQLVADGVKELNLISQDSTYYGLDLRQQRNGSIAAPDRFQAAARSLPANATTLCTLLRALNDLEGDFWIRLLYTHPAHWTDELIQTIAECPKVARYVDMPLQHIHPAMLERMRRETDHHYILNLIDKIRAGIPQIALRTTFIVGFPGETDEYFQSLIDFIRSTKFERLGVFTYSPEEDTRAAKMMGQIPDRLKKRRQSQAMAAQLAVARQISASFLGRTLKVLVEKEATPKDLAGAQISSWEHGFIRAEKKAPAKLKGKYWIARGEADAPDIDGRIYISGQVPPGEFAQVRIIGHTDYDLIAEPLA